MTPSFYIVKGIFKFESYYPTFEALFLTRNTLGEHSILLFVIKEGILIYIHPRRCEYHSISSPHSQSKV